MLARRGGSQTSSPKAFGISSDESRVNRSAQRHPPPLCARERSGQRGKQRHVPDRIDRRPDGREVLADLDQKRRHMSERVFYPDTNDVSSTSRVLPTASPLRHFNDSLVTP